MRILFITAHRLGDAVISTATLHALSHRYPQARFTIVCGPAVSSLFRAMPRCERLIVMVKQRYNYHWCRLWRVCVKTRWFMVVDVRSSLISYLLWARHRVVIPGGRRPGLKMEQQIGALPFPVSSSIKPTVWVTQEEKDYAHAALPALHPLLALAPTAGTPAKAWPRSYFVALARRFMREGFRPVIFYGPGEVEASHVAPILQNVPEAIDMGGERPLGEVACLLQQCRLFVGNDSGLMHLAAAASVPTLGLFGPSCVSQYAPSGAYVMTLCAPGAEGRGAMESITVDDVLRAAQRLYRARHDDQQ